MTTAHRLGETDSVAARQACLNCGATLTGPFCAECGQRDIPPYPSTRELAVDAIIKEVAIGVIYSVVSFVAFIVMIYWVSVTT